jgi:hypothetical protein
VSGVPWRTITSSGLDDWIYWHFYYNYNQLQQLTINGCPRLAPFPTRLQISLLLRDDVILIYESVTSSASVVRWLTLHRWTSNSLTTGLQLSRSFLHGSLNRLPVNVESVCFHGNVLTEPLPSKSLFHVCSLLRERMFGKPLASNGLPLWLHYSGCQALRHNICISIFNVYK